MYKKIVEQLAMVDDGVGAGNSYRHFCSYSIIRRTIEILDNGKRWIERCRCRRCIVIDCKYIAEGSKSPQIIKSWYDADGNLERVTGDVDEKDKITSTHAKQVDKSINDSDVKA